MSQREAVPTYKQRVLEALRAAGERGVCLADVDRDLAHTLRNRCGELAREGHHIERRSCMWHDHRSATVARYILRPTGETSAAGSGTTPKPFEANVMGAAAIQIRPLPLPARSRNSCRTRPDPVMGGCRDERPGASARLSG